MSKSANSTLVLGAPSHRDAQATSGQQEALRALDSGAHGGPIWEIFATVCPTVLEPVVASIHLEVDRKRRRATMRIPEVGAIEAEPIKTPVTGAEHRVRIMAPRGFELGETEMGNAVLLRATAGDAVCH